MQYNAVWQLEPKGHRVTVGVLSIYIPNFTYSTLQTIPTLLYIHTHGKMAVEVNAPTSAYVPGTYMTSQDSMIKVKSGMILVKYLPFPRAAREYTCRIVTYHVRRLVMRRL